MFQFIPRKVGQTSEHHDFDRRVFFAINSWYFSNEKPLSVRMICQKVDAAPSTVHRSLTRLTNMGYIKRDGQGVLRLTDKRWKD